MNELAVSSGSIIWNQYEPSALCAQSTTTSWMEQYGEPKLLSVIDGYGVVEITYIETAMTYIMYGYNDTPPRRVFKIIYSCVDGKFHKSERIYGKIIPATDEMYEFE